LGQNIQSLWLIRGLTNGNYPLSFVSHEKFSSDSSSKPSDTSSSSSSKNWWQSWTQANGSIGTGIALYTVAGGVFVWTVDSRIEKSANRITEKVSTEVQDLRKEVQDLRKEMSKEVQDLRKEISKELHILSTTLLRYAEGTSSRIAYIEGSLGAKRGKSAWNDGSLVSDENLTNET
jgi:hypothetical protein